MKWWDRAHMKPLYRIIQAAYLLTLRIFFKRGYYSGYSNIPSGKPVMLVCNHVNAFQDPIVLASSSRRTFHWLVRGDIFKKGWVRFLLVSLNQLPIFRPRDGIRNMTKNQDTYDGVTRLLKRRAVVMIFAEGDCVPEKRLRPFKKGTARMAFSSAEQNGWDSDIHLIPAGVNYTQTEALRSEFMVSIGRAVPIMNYKKLYDESPAKAVNQLTSDLYEGVKENLVIVEHKETEAVCEGALRILRTERAETSFPWRRDAKDRIKAEKELCRNINKLYEEDNEKYVELANRLKVYDEMLDRYRLSDYVFHGKRTHPFLSVLILVFFAPNAFLGWMLTVVQFRWVMRFVKKNIKKLEFRSSIKIGFLIVIQLVLGLILSIIVGMAYEWWAFFLVLPTWWFLALTTVNWQEQLRLTRQVSRFRALSNEIRDEINSKRNAILEMLNN